MKRLRAAAIASRDVRAVVEKFLRDVCSISARGDVQGGVAGVHVVPAVTEVVWL